MSRAVLRLPALAMLAFCWAPLGAQQDWKPDAGTTTEQLKPRPGEVSIEKALEASRAFLKKIGVDVPALVPHVRRVVREGRLSHYLSIYYVDEAAFVVDLGTGVMTSFQNTHRQEEHAKGTIPSGPLLLGDLLAANNFAWTVMREIGLPADCKLKDLQLLNLPGNQTRPNAYASVNVIFQPAPFGYPIQDAYASHGLVLDPYDGAVMSYMDAGAICGQYEIESRNCTLTLREAAAKADPIAKKYGVGGPLARTEEKQMRSELMLVHPNGLLGGLLYGKDESPARLRLAWVVRYAGNEELWIDASDGKLLGAYPAIVEQRQPRKQPQPAPGSGG